MNIQLAEQSAQELFKHLDIGLLDETPKRYVLMLKELTEYHNISNAEIAQTVNKMFEIDCPATSQKMIIAKDIACFSLCEHHIALMYDMKISIAYIPQQKIIGLSKLTRLVDMVCKRLQLQEKIAEDIIEVMSILNQNRDIAVYITAKHSCITARGIRNTETSTISTNFSGAFKDNLQLQSNFLQQVT